MPACSKGRSSSGSTGRTVRAIIAEKIAIKSFRAQDTAHKTSTETGDSIFRRREFSNCRKFPRMRNIMRIQRPDLITLQGHQRHRVAIIAHQLHLERGSLAMRLHSGAYISKHQTVIG